LGNEAHLMATYSVSRATLREAIRQLERHGVATMRRGFGGGLVVLDSARMAAVQAMATYLELTDVSLDELFEARAVLELQSVDLAIRRLSDLEIQTLRGQLRTLQQAPPSDTALELECAKAIRLTVTGASRNLALSLFMEALNRVTGGFMPDPGRLAAMTEHRARSRDTICRLAEAVISGSPLEAEQAVLARVAAVKEVATANLKYYTRVARRKSALDRGAEPHIAEWNDSRKLPHRLAIAIAREVAQGKNIVGHRIGSEPEFLARYGVSRAIFREAIRLLESYGIVQIRRGHGGGLSVGSPSPARTVSLVSSYLIQGKLESAQFYEVLEGLELAVAPRAALRADAGQIQVLREAAALLVGRDRREVVEGVSAQSLALKACIGNRAINLVGQVIHQVAPRYRSTLPSKVRCQQLLAQHTELLGAIAARDAAMARRIVLRMVESHAFVK
jgi:DNA-binding FadR family transcriptional regulator